MYWMVPYTRKVRNRWISRSRKYWAGQKVRLGLSVTSYGKTWMNFSANPVQDKVKAHSTTRVPRLPKLQTKARSHWPELPQPAGLCLPSQSPLTVISGKSPNTFVPLPSRWSIDGLTALEGDTGHLTLSNTPPPGMPPCWTQKLPRGHPEPCWCSCLGLGCGRLWSLSDAAGLDLMNPSFSCPY